MRTPSIIIALSAFSLGCGLQTDLSAVDELLVSSLSGEEDSVSGESGARMSETGGEGEDRTAPPPMFRECDAQGTFVGFVDAYDEDRSGELEDMEAQDAMAEHGGPRGGPRAHFLHLLRVVYDADISRQFEDAELESIFEDFTARCSAIHEDVVAEYDADGDGALSDAEQSAAREGHMAEAESQREAMDACRPEGPPPEGEGARRGPPEEGEVPFGPLEEEFDADGSGDLSTAELTTLRETLRDRIRSGDRPQPACDAG